MNEQQTSEELSWRILLCHKHPVSARLRFLIPTGGGVVLPQTLPRLAVIAEDQEAPVQCHPASALRALQETMALGWQLELIGEFRLNMEVPGQIMPIYLAALAGHELPPPPEGTRWIELTQSIGMPWLDRELLRRVYEELIGFGC
ncbi:MULTISPECIES: hypothetical protein [Azotobacter]|uniref:hypothetical protein n=1 Tax=Azotobacter TaxID=352 RepID=UPI000045A37F|nr:hypothetical protein [Azotobacter vinelandii]WKN22199.1 hypothetical protein AVAEIV_000149 [Azotobacter vinelandii]GLK58115.1 hypothetical protein GCM10017624_02720 [Azotobacter vinelandii]SFX77064.1 hypothetical protein SAMN04244547_02707 [Azotobacter vinelandii]